MPRYRISGNQRLQGEWFIDAESEDEAIQIIENDEPPLDNVIAPMGSDVSNIIED